MKFNTRSDSNFQNGLREHCRKLNIRSYQQIEFEKSDGYFIAELQDVFIARLIDADPNALEFLKNLW
jgi:hypothetical protein